MARKSDYGFDQSPTDPSPSGARPNIHADETPLVSLLDSVPDQQSSDTYEFGAMKSAKRYRSAEPLRTERQGLRSLSFERAAERLGVAPKAFQSHASE